MTADQLHGWEGLQRMIAVQTKAATELDNANPLPEITGRFIED
jgi:hypothetical protein